MTEENKIFTEIKCIREKELLKVVPFSKTTLWRNVKNGTFPKPFKLSEKVTVWRVVEVQNWLNEVSIERYVREQK